MQQNSPCARHHGAIGELWYRKGQLRQGRGRLDKQKSLAKIVRLVHRIRTGVETDASQNVLPSGAFVLLGGQGHGRSDAFVGGAAILVPAAAALLPVSELAISRAVRDGGAFCTLGRGAGFAALEAAVR